MIEFQQAIENAKRNLLSLVADAKNITLEEALISKNKKNFEITISYQITGQDNLDLSEEKHLSPNMKILGSLLNKRRLSKIFIIDRHTGEFRGFRNRDEI